MIIFEWQILPQQTIYHWKETLTESMVHIKYRENIFISRLYEQTSRNDLKMAPEGLSKKFQTFKI